VIALAVECLAAEPADRPRDAGVVAARVSAYLAAVQERQRAAEVEHAGTQARAEAAAAKAAAQRHARRLLLGLAAAALLLVAVGGTAAWALHRHRAAVRDRQLQADREVGAALQRARGLLEEGWQAHDLARLEQANAEAQRAADIAGSGSAAEEVQIEADDLLKQAAERLERASRNRRLLDALLDVTAPPETRTYRSDASGRVTTMDQPGLDEQYDAAFRGWEPSLGAAEVPAEVRQEVIVGVDGWVQEQRRALPEARWRRLDQLVRRLDPDPRRRELRRLLADPPPTAEGVVGLLGAWPPWPAVWELGRGIAWRRAQVERTRTNLSHADVPTVVLLAQAGGAVGDAAGAEQMLREALAKRPGQPVLLDALGRLLDRQGPSRLGEAIAYYQTVCRKRPRLGINVSRALSRTGSVLAGETVLRDLIRQQPDNVDLQFYLGLTLLEQKKSREAADAFRKAVAGRKDWAAAHYNLGLALAAAGDARGAGARFREAVALNPAHALAQHNLGQFLLSEGNRKGAIHCFQRAVALEPQFALAHCNLGNARRAVNDVQGAGASFRRALALDPRLRAARAGLGGVLEAEGDRDGAVACYRQAVALDPAWAVGHNLLGAALEARGDREAALAGFREAVRLDRNYALAYYNLGNSLKAKGWVEDAVASFRKAVGLDPKLARAHASLGALLYAANDLEGGSFHLRKAIDLHAGDARAHYQLGLYLRDKKDRRGAIAHFRKAAELDPRNADARRNLADVLRATGDLQGAVAGFRKAVELDPGNADSHLALGSALWAQRDVGGAAASYRRALKLDGDRVEAHAELGQVLLYQGRFTEARRVLGRGMKLLQDGQSPRKYASARRKELEPVLFSALKDCTAKLDLDGLLTIWLLDKARAEARWQTSRLLRVFAAEAAAQRLTSPMFPVFSAEMLLNKAADRLAFRLALAELCHKPYKQRYAAAAHLYHDVFAASRETADDPSLQHRYRAATAAALAAAGRGVDAPRPNEKERTQLRGLALGWLKADLDAWADLAGNEAGQRRSVLQILTHWRADPDLAAVRDKAALAKLPPSERDAWRKLWADVDDLLRRIRKNR
jgi:superkiller protein 3